MTIRYVDDDGIHNLAERLRIARLAMHLTQEEAANVTLISQSAISIYEQARREPYVLATKRMAEAYGVTMDWLLSISEDGGPDILRGPMPVTKPDGGAKAKPDLESDADADPDPDADLGWDPDEGADAMPDPDGGV